MKQRWPIYLALILASGVLLVAWTVRPEGSEPPPEIAKELTSANRMPWAGFSGSPPYGTVWETYVVPLPYARVTEAMKLAPNWERKEEKGMLGIPKNSYSSKHAGPQAQINVMPGRLFIVDQTGKVPGGERPEKYSVVMVATPLNPTFRKRALAWLDRLLGRKPPSLPTGSFVAYQYPHEYRPALSRRGGRP